MAHIVFFVSVYSIVKKCNVIANTYSTQVSLNRADLN